MGRVAVGAADVVAPVFAAAEVVVFLTAGVAAQARFRRLFGRLVLEGDDLRRIAFFNVRLAWTMARFTARYLRLPARQPG